MFYPDSALHKGGRYYLLWVADTYPKTFASIANRKLWSHSNDIRKLCDDLHEMIRSESGRALQRFSLRLSSQLIRGLVRVYHRKSTILLNELCMIYANVDKHANKKYTGKTQNRPRGQIERQRKSAKTTEQRVEDENRVEEMLQRSANVANIEDITLKEAAIPNILLPPIDGFGELNGDQALQSVLEPAGDRTVEMMMMNADGTAQRSAFDLPALEQTHEKTRLGALDVEMEMIPGHELTMRPSVGLRSLADVEKEIPEIPDVPLIPIPDQPAPQEKQLSQADAEVPQPVDAQRKERPRDQEVPEIELEELEEILPRQKRQRRLIIDKKTVIDSKVLRERIQNPTVELRYENAHDAVIDIRVPAHVYMNRPCHAGSRQRSMLAPRLSRMFMRHLGYIHRDPSTDREIERVLTRPQRQLRSQLEDITEIQEPVPPQEQQNIPEQGENVPAQIENTSAQEENIQVQEGNLPALVVEYDAGPVQQDISELPTQKLPCTPDMTREGRKRVSDQEISYVTKRRRHAGVLSVKETQQKSQRSEAARQSMSQGQTLPTEMEVDKENVPLNQQTPRASKSMREHRVSSILQEVGLTDILQEVPENPAQQLIQDLRTSRDRSETPLGSLDRTRVSLGDSVQSTESSKFIALEWSTQSAMLKLMSCFKQRQEGEMINIDTLIAKGPILPGYKRIIVAKCFSSILKLKQHGLIEIIKCPGSNDIADIRTGPALENLTY